MDEPLLKILHYRIGEALDLRPVKGSNRGTTIHCGYTPEKVLLRLKDDKRWFWLTFVEVDGRIHAELFLERNKFVHRMLPGIDFVSESVKSDLLKLNDALDGALPSFFDQAVRTFFGEDA